MKRQSSKPFLLFLAALFIVMSFPRASSERVRGLLFASMAPVWEMEQNIVSASAGTEEEVMRLQAEIQLLHNQLELWQELYQHEHQLNVQMSQAMGFGDAEGENLSNLLKIQLEAIPAKVIFRSPSSWNSALWVNVGTADNEQLGRTVIAKNSPVVIGASVVGILDYVGKHQSRVRLITDTGIAPSVRALRGKAKNRRLIEMMAFLQQEIENPALYAELENTKKALRSEDATWHLAKGELRGSSQPLWRSQSSVLHGVGFNYDFSDGYGSARDLRTGEPEDRKGEARSIIEEDDLLVTTGMDGIFPPGLRVARVTHIDMLKEGDYFYELEAIPTAGSLTDLSMVFVLPAQGYDSEDQPSLWGR